MNPPEQICLVDKNDEIIGKKYRDQLTNDDTWRIISIWVINPAGQILLQQRSLSKKVNPGVWTAAVEGTVPAGENYETCAQREIKEELGIQTKLATAGHYYGPWGGFGKRHCQGFTAEIDLPADEIQFQASEVQQVKWFSKQELNQLAKNSPELFPLYEIYLNLGFI